MAWQKCQNGVGHIMTANTPLGLVVDGYIGLNVMALKDKIFHIGLIKLEYGGICQRCLKMESGLGEGWR